MDGWMDDKSSSDPNISIITDHTDRMLYVQYICICMNLQYLR